MEIAAVYEKQKNEDMVLRAIRKTANPQRQHYCLLYFIESCEFTWKNGGTDRIPKSSFCLLHSDKISNEAAIFSADYAVLISETHEQMPLPMRMGIAAQVILSTPQEETGDLTALFQLLSHMYIDKNNRTYADYAASRLLEMLLWRTRLLTLEKTCLTKPDSNTAALVELREQIYREPARNWSIDEMCETVRISRTHLQRVFSDTFGCSCYQDVLRSRLIYADRLLCETDIPICKIAQQCGFDSDSTFIRAFKRFRGCTPTAFRQNPHANQCFDARQGAQSE